MEIYCVIGARFEADQPVEFLMGITDTGSGGWVQKPVQVSLEDVVGCLEGGYAVTTAYLEGNSFAGGPQLRLVEAVPGRKSVDVVGEPVPGRGLRDLPRM